MVAKKKVTLSVRHNTYRGTEGWLVSGSDQFGRNLSIFYTPDREDEARELVRRVKAGEDSNDISDEQYKRRKESSKEPGKSSYSSYADRRGLGGGDVPDIGSEDDPVKSQYGLPAYRKNGFWYIQGYSMSGSGERTWTRITDPRSQNEIDALYPEESISKEPSRKPLADMTKAELKKLRVILHILPDGTMEITEKGKDSLERQVASWNPPNRPDMTELSRIGGYIYEEDGVIDNAESWLDAVAKKYDLDPDEIIADSWHGGGMRHKASPYDYMTNTFTGKVKTIKGDDTETDKTTNLQSIHESRSPLSQSSDERQTNLVTIDPDDPKVERWKRDPGSMDVRGIDTPDTPTKGNKNKKAKKTTKKSRKKPNTTMGSTR